MFRPGTKVPFFVSSPFHKPGVTNDFTSLLDITPTVLDWFGINYPKYKLFGHPVNLTGNKKIFLISV